MLGAEAVWIGTRFVTAKESGASEFAKKSVIESGFDSAIKSIVWSGRPLRALSNPYIADWEQNRQAEIKELTDRGIVPLEHELDKLHTEGKLTEEIQDYATLRYGAKFSLVCRFMLTCDRPMGVVAGLVNKPNQSAKEIVDEIVAQAAEILSSADRFVASKSKL